DALEALEHRPVEERCDRAARGVELHDPVLEVRDKDAAVLVNLEAVGLAVVLGGERDLGVGGDAEDAAIGYVDHVEVALSVEARTLEEARRRGTGPLDLDPTRSGRRARTPEAIGDAREDRGLDDGRRSVHRARLSSQSIRAGSPVNSMEQ